ncbi:hypothetical protein E2C01_046200 [Portunus trituberculatus]|uniref:Uncharacterized protein n=1 Tax=Portunus trituberculatus TaxID=210409 RepID=A0A5B7G4E9_PORTR|nr:hypothetical protein [Portunus trituberculatus]
MNALRLDSSSNIDSKCHDTPINFFLINFCNICCDTNNDNRYRLSLSDCWLTLKVREPVTTKKNKKRWWVISRQTEPETNSRLQEEIQGSPEANDMDKVNSSKP